MKFFFVLILFSFVNVISAQATCEKYESLKKAFKEDNIESVCELDLQNQNLKELPANLGSLINLEILHLENNKLSTLPESIVNSKKLVRIHLDNNSFTIFGDKVVGKFFVVSKLGTFR